MTQSKNTQAKAEQITRALLRVKGYLDDNEQPTPKAKNSIKLMGGRLLLTPKGKKELQRWIDEDNGLLALLGRLDLSQSTKELTNEIIKFGIWKN